VPGACALLGACVLVQCKKVPPCQATVTLANESALGEGPDKAKAFGQACIAHCLEHDRLVDGKYRVWRAAGGKGAGKRADDIQSVPVLKRYLDACTERCAKEAKDVRYVDCPSS
jgi:hypothetical protein